MGGGGRESIGVHPPPIFAGVESNRPVLAVRSATARRPCLGPIALIFVVFFRLPGKTQGDNCGFRLLRGPGRFILRADAPAFPSVQVLGRSLGGFVRAGNYWN
jgi:hypothetical protein